jgi:hypothetical protein
MVVMAAGGSGDGGGTAGAAGFLGRAFAAFAGLLAFFGAVLRVGAGRRLALFPLATLRGFFGAAGLGDSGHGTLAITAPRGAGRIR